MQKPKLTVFLGGGFVTLKGEEFDEGACVEILSLFQSQGKMLLDLPAVLNYILLGSATLKESITAFMGIQCMAYY